ncbi:MAG: virulence factor TspB C-terminal domain-related protein [Polaromonas sp.]|uniref:virulence factor TspB C-terminal domain-related protein n=1 Tax=Polaromonas sp. TaxID=1869339 RepID=UPI002734E36F|nr:virulence factor TspB C-terminal domain-related protein [Polaromonas sp.]MDP3798884.1 virulence factor TspB C-terminal domain-related protein [Polaromonas sp.]
MNKNVWNRDAFCAWLGAAALCCFSLVAPVHAKGYAPSYSKTSTGFEVRQAPSTTGVSSLGPVAGGVGVTASVALPVTGSAIAQAGITGAIGGAATAGAWGAAAGALGGIAIAAIPAIVDMMLRAKARVKADGTFEMADPTVCTVSPCYEYQFPSSSTSAASGYYKKGQDACTYAVGKTYYSRVVTASTFRLHPTVAGAGICDLAYTSGSPDSTNINSRSTSPSPETYIDATQAQVQAAISVNAPSSAEVQALIDLNFPPEITPVSITGPAELPLGNTVQLGIDGTKTTVEEKATFSYFPGKVDISTKTKTTVETPAQTQTGVTTNPDGTTSTFTITKPATTTVLEDTQAEVPKDDRDECAQYPNRVGCLEVDTPEGEIPKSTASLTYSAENLGFGSGACPANRTATLRNGQTITVFDYTKPCEWIVNWVRPLILALSAWIAFFILMPGGKAE